tara:strand:- start:1033 stop:1713 length:681 start_codon:yes stop_codon:yes gene_type:complete
MKTKFKTLFSTIIFLFVGINTCAAQEYNKYYINHSSSSFIGKNGLLESVKGEAIDLDLLNATIFHLTNIERSELNLPKLMFGGKLYKSAQLHSNKMVQLNFFSHTNKFEKKWREPKDRILHFENKYTSLGENILENNLLNYKGKVLNYRIEEQDNGKIIYLDSKGLQIKYSTYLQLANRLVQQWMNSEPHKKNILSKSYSLLGCACAINPDEIPIMIRCTQNFGRL